MNLRGPGIVVFIALMFWANFLHSQSIEGRVLNEEENVADIHVINFSTNKATITNADGYFNLSAKEGDIIRFSAIQFAVKELVVNQTMLDGFMVVVLSNSLTELDEVIVWPYMLSGELLRDVKEIEVDVLITASTLGLPNAEVKKRIQSERLLYTARTWDLRFIAVKLDPLINAISGRTKMLKKRVARDLQEAKYIAVYDSFDNTILAEQLKIPRDRIHNFYHYCEADSRYDSIIDLGIKGDVFNFMVSKSIAYRKINELD